MKKMCVLLSGCDAHTADFRQMVENLRDEYELTSLPSNADLIVQYFCSNVFQQLDQIAFELDYVNKVKKADAIYIVVGCAVEILGSEFLTENKYADYAFPRCSWVHDIVSLLKNKEPEIKFYMDDKPWRYSIDIVGGCVRKGGYCTFCKQNHMRIPVKSIPMDELVRRITDVSKSECISRVNLCGLNTCNYGIDFGDGKPKLHELIRHISAIPTVKNISIVSLTVGDMYDELFEELTTNPKVFSISLGYQSGSDKMLKKMNVHSTVAQNQYCVDKLSHLSNHSIVVIGHPGETEETVQETIDFIRKNNLWYLQVSAYANGPGTPAYEMEQLPSEVCNNYTSLVRNTVKELAQNFADNLIGTWVDACLAYGIHGVKADVIFMVAEGHNHHMRLEMLLEKASTHPTFERLQNLARGARIRCKINKAINIDPTNMIFEFNEVEVI